MKQIINFFCILLCPLFSIAQFYIRGEIKDEKNNPLQNASIRLGSTGYVYYSGAEGGFGIQSNNKKDSLTISIAGFLQEVRIADPGQFLTIVLKKAPPAAGKKLSSKTRNLSRDYQEAWFTGDETYASTVENQFVDAIHYPGTSVALSADRASYSNIRRFINSGSPVPPDAVRIEEMINYFNIGYHPPTGNNNFDINTTLTGCPWKPKDQLLFVNICSRVLDLKNLPSAHLIFLIDVSGSMEIPNRLPLIKEAFKTLVNNLRAKDSISIVVYGGTTSVILEAASGSEKKRIIKTIDSLGASGATPGASGIQLAYRVARNHFIKGGNNRIIMATDGDFNVGLKSEDELESLIVKEKHSGVYLTCLGMGMGNYKDSKIQTLAQWGNGNFAYLDSYAEAEKVLLHEFTQTLYSVAENAILEILFDPGYVKEYRLLGFDNKAGAIKDTAATLEGGVVGPGSAILLVFEIIPSGDAGLQKRGDLKINFNLQYCLTDSKSSINFPLSKTTPLISFDSADNAFRFTSSVIMFGSVLRESRYRNNITWNGIIQLAKQSLDKNFPSQKEYVSIVEKAKIIYGRKRKKEKN